MFYYVFPVITLALQWVLYRWAVDTFPWVARHKRAVVVGLVVLFVFDLVGRRAEIHYHVTLGLRTVTTAVMMTLLLAAVPIGLMRAVAALGARLRRGSAPAPAPDPAAVTRRQLVEGTGGFALLGVTGSMMGWGMARGRLAFELREVPIRIAGLPRALDGYAIVQVSDIHTGFVVGERELDAGLALVRRARGDLMVVTGDLVDADPTFAPLVARKLSALAPRDGAFACLGNHDYYAGAGAVVDALRGAGIRTLINDGLVVRPDDGGGFALLGVDDQWSRRFRGPGPRLDEALARVRPDAPRILLSHQPPTVDAWAGRVALQLSGHTHGGQINPGGLRPADLFFKYVAGLYRAGETTLYVNSGFGTVGPPARVNAPPEITRIVLVAA